MSIMHGGIPSIPGKRSHILKPGRKRKMNTIKSLLAKKLPEGIKNFMNLLYTFTCPGTGTLFYKRSTIAGHITGRGCYFQDSLNVFNKKRTASYKFALSETAVDSEIF